MIKDAFGNWVHADDDTLSDLVEPGPDQWRKGLTADDDEERAFWSRVRRTDVVVIVL